MLRADAHRAIYDRLDAAAVVTIMGAVAAELQGIGHRPNFFYLQHGMGLASSVGLGIALSRPELPVVVFDDGEGTLGRGAVARTGAGGRTAAGGRASSRRSRSGATLAFGRASNSEISVVPISSRSPSRSCALCVIRAPFT